MKINSYNQYSRNIIPFLDGIELHNCLSFDTDKNEAICLCFERKTLFEEHITVSGEITFKLRRGATIDAEFFEQLTNDKGFRGFVDELAKKPIQGI